MRKAELREACSNVPFVFAEMRRKLQKLVPPPGDAEAAAGDEEDDAPMIVLEGGLRTDSSVGFPPNPWQSEQ